MKKPKITAFFLKNGLTRNLKTVLAAFGARYWRTSFACCTLSRTFHINPQFFENQRYYS